VQPPRSATRPAPPRSRSRPRPRPAYESLLSTEDIAQIEKIGGEELRRLGYTSLTLPRPFWRAQETLGGLAGELGVVEVGVQAAGGEKFRVRAALDNPAGVDDQDLVASLIVESRCAITARSGG